MGDWDGWMWDLSPFIGIAMDIVIFAVPFTFLFYLTFRLSGRNKKCWLLLLLIPVGLWPFLQFVLGMMCWSIKGFAP